MAELNVQPKKSSPIWWIILIIIVVLIILYFVFRNNNTTNGVNVGTDSTGMIKNKIDTPKNTIAMFQWQKINDQQA
jgi:uncharacterized phage infection (PIP) family protein YhgE